MPAVCSAAEPAALEEFFAAWPGAAVFEDGRLLFDLRLARCSATAEHGRRLLHLWSDERNMVGTVTATVPRRETPQLQPERRLESMLRWDLSALDPAPGGGPVYPQVPAFASEPTAARFADGDAAGPVGGGAEGGRRSAPAPADAGLLGACAPTAPGG